MRIAMVSEHASPLAVVGGVDAGGQNVHVAALARAIGRRGHEVVVHTRRDSPEPPRRVRLADGVEVDHVDAGAPRPIPKDELLPFMDAFADDLAERWRAERPDVVHAHFWMSAHAALAAAQPLGIPVVQTFHALGVVKRRHQGDKDTSPSERHEIEREIVQRADRLVCTCTDEVFELVRLGADRSRLVVIPCGVELERFTPDGPRESRRRGRTRLLCIGRLVERKGIGNVISALRELPDTELIVAGGLDREQLDADPEARRLLDLARREGVADRVELRGHVSRDELPALLRSGDVLVTVPWYEPFGITPLEAMACGVPVVAAAVGGLIDSVVDGVTGVHVPPRDPERLVVALRDLLASPRRRAAMGREGVRRARELYDWNRVAASTLGVYRALAGPARGPRRRSFARAATTSTGAREHVRALAGALQRVQPEFERAEGWGRGLAERLVDGGRLLAVGNGGSAAEAQHLTAELVGRFETERAPLSAICLHGDTSSLTAICNDYGADEGFARQVRAHGRPGDVLLALSTSGRSANVVAAAAAARELGMTTWAMTGAAPNPLADCCDDAIALDLPRPATVQELHMVAVHVLCGAVDRAIAERDERHAQRVRA
jgi:glycosyltransferase involved in cell wall biosynthesis/phosphoheptose isomerase